VTQDGFSTPVGLGHGSLACRHVNAWDLPSGASRPYAACRVNLDWVQWGTVPAWLAAIGTVGGLGYALRLFSREGKASREHEADRLREHLGSSLLGSTSATR
jgi:hypothetical protein